MSADSPLAARLRSRLHDLDARALTRVMRPPSGLDLSSNDYLGLSRDPRVQEAFAAGLAREGVGSTGSRLLRGDRDAFAAVERRFARFKGTERALFFSSGYLANVGLLSALGEPGDVIFSDALNHASLIDGCRLSRARVVVVPHNDVAALARAIASTPCDGVRFVVVESLYSMDGDRSPLADLAALCAAHGATLVVDEAHAVGVRGERGSGLIEECGLDANLCVSVNAGGKALGVGGAFVAGPAALVEYLVQRARTFVFSTAAPPAIADALQASLEIVEREPQRRQAVRHVARTLRRALRRAGFDVADDDSQIVPVVVGDNDRALTIATALQTQGFDIRAIRPPTVPENTARLRLSVNALLGERDMDRVVDALQAAWRLEAQPTGA